MPAQHDSPHLFPRLPILLLVNKDTGVIYADFNATCMLILSPARGAGPTDYDSGVIATVPPRLLLPFVQRAVVCKGPSTSPANITLFLRCSQRVTSI
jgi:hypothetical protein